MLFLSGAVVGIVGVVGVADVLRYAVSEKLGLLHDGVEGADEQTLLL